MSQIRMEHDGAVYTFSRNSDGEGRWICVGGTPSGFVGSRIHNFYVHLELNSVLVRAAVESGLGSVKDFSRYLKKEKPEVIRVSRPKKYVRKTGLFGSGVSLGSIFDHIDTEEQHEIREYEEIETGVSQ